jgi:hypothetical protein
MQYWHSLSSHTHGFIGVVIVEANNPLEAGTKVYEIAPDAFDKACEIAVVECPEAYDSIWLDRLIVKPEIDLISYSTLKGRPDVPSSQCLT